MFKKLIRIVIGILVLALIAFVAREHIISTEPAYASSTTLTVLSGEEVFLNEEEVSGTEIVQEGNSIKTGRDSWALVTFEDGSTIELEPNTEISIKEMTDTSITLWQEAGRTWSGVKKLVGPLTNFEIETPAAAAVVRGTLVEIFVYYETQDTLTAAFEGTVEVTAQGVTQIVEAWWQSLTEIGEAPGEPEPVPPPKNRLDFTIEGPAWALVVDPQERSVGVVPPSVVVAQIPRAATTGAQAEPQFIVMPVPEEEGEKTYYVVLYGKEEGGKVSVVVEGYAEGQQTFTTTKDKVVSPYEKIGDEETKYVATLIVTLDAEGLIIDGELGDFELKETEGPGKVEIKDWAVARAEEAVEPQANFSASVDVEEEAIRFTNLSSGDITSYFWDFGDGETSTIMNPPPHPYSEGRYLVSLKVEGVPPEEGVPAPKDKMSKEIYVLFVEVE